MDDTPRPPESRETVSTREADLEGGPGTVEKSGGSDSHTTGRREGTDDPDRILVLDAHKNASLVFGRALEGQNVEITSGGWSRVSPGMLSRHATDRFLYSSPYRKPERFVAELTGFLRANDYFAVVPMSDLTHALLSKQKTKLEQTGTAVGVEDWETFVTANDKRSLAGLLEDLGVPGPRTRAPESADDVDAIKDEFTYPVLIKPRFTTVLTDDGTYTEARISDENYVHSPDQLVRRYGSLVETYDYFREEPPIVQEVLSGAVTATCGLAADGEFVAYFQEERLRMYPVDGGSSSLRRGIHEPEMAEHARKIVAALEWTGPIYIEFIGSDDGSFTVLEVNGRYWGSVGCAICGGVNVPLLHYQQLKGAQLTPKPGYETGRKQRRLFYTDLRWLSAQLEAGNYRAVAPFVRSFFDSDHDVLAADDPLPTLGAILWAIRETVRSGGPVQTPKEPERSPASGSTERFGGGN